MRRDHSSLVSSLTDLVVLIAILLCATAGIIRSTATSRESTVRIKCASNLRQIGLAIQIYAHDNKGAFPRTIFDGAVNPVPTEYTGVNAPNPFGVGGPGPNDVTAPLYLLLRTTDTTSEPFICPTSPDRAVKRWVPPIGTAITSFSNFAGRVNLSYAYTNPYPSQAAKKLGYKLNYTLDSDFAIAADMGRGPIAANVPANASRAKMVAANSPNHAGDGQNVLYADGHVGWSPTVYCGFPRPVSGAPRDNIYAFGVDTLPDRPSAGTHGAPQDQYDSVILPTDDLGPQPGPIPPPLLSPQNKAWLTGAIVAVALAFGVVVVWVMTRAKSKNPPAPPSLPPTPAR